MLAALIDLRLLEQKGGGVAPKVGASTRPRSSWRIDDAPCTLPPCELQIRALNE